MRGQPLWLLISLLALVSLLDSFKQRAEERQILQRAEQASVPATEATSQQSEQMGTAVASDGVYRFTTTDLWSKVSEIPGHRRFRFYVWTGDQTNPFTGSAPGVDRNAYFANSFLVGYQPFHSKTVWEPLATLALRKNYILDHHLYGPNMAEIWQNSRQAFASSHGDCEDHALILADWLISLGHDARVVLGEYRNGGHAWVILFRNGREYVLEATSKRRPRSINDFTLAGLATDYLPMYQFNRDDFWVNTGSKYTTRYNDGKWQVGSRFKRNRS